jgi:RNA polymerase sigma-70 factor, ECF subfamily
MAGNSTSVTFSAAIEAPPAVAHPPREFEDVYDELFPFVWRNARRMGVPAAALDDVCQEVFVVVHRRLGELENRASLRPWAYAILRNRVLVYRRGLQRKSPEHRSQQPLVDAALLTDDRSDPHEALSTAESARIARGLLDELDEEKRTVLVLVEIEEMSVPEVAEATGANLNTTYARLRAARGEFAAAAQRFRAKDGWRMP